MTPEPSARFHTSVTERSSFQTCRRRWYLETVENVTPSGSVTWYFIFGDVWHSAMDAYYQPKSSRARKPLRSIANARDAFLEAWEEKNRLLQDIYAGVYTLGIEEEWVEQREKGLQMLTYYGMFDKEHPLFDTVVEIGLEERAFVDILDPAERAHLSDLPLLSGRIDLVGQKKDKRIIVVDHKALASMAHDRALDLDDQLTGYAYILWRTLGISPHELYYNVALKDPPKPPRLIEQGKKLSQDKAQRTTYDLYLAALKEQGFTKDGYREFLTFLKAKGWDQFFRRLGPVPRKSRSELLSFEERLYYQHLDMKAAIHEEEWRYPNPTQYTCPGCPVMSICKAMEEGDDVDFILESGYTVAPARVSIPEAILNPKWEGV